jgi:hypothetical protein
MSVALGSAPRCAWCGEEPHEMRHCPACQGADETRKQLLECRAALRCMTPRYIELFEHCGLGPAGDSIAVEMAREALGLPNIGHEPRAK